jgi:hypothetical protein
LGEFLTITEMFSLEESRHLLGSTAENLSDAEVLEIRDLLFELAEMAVEDFFSRRRHAGSIPLPTSEETC